LGGSAGALERRELGCDEVGQRAFEFGRSAVPIAQFDERRDHATAVGIGQTDDGGVEHGGVPAQATLSSSMTTTLFKDGSSVAATAEIARGHPRLPLTAAQLKSKYLDCFAVSDVLEPSAADELYGQLSVLHQVRDVNDLNRLPRPR
jgi:hypothetical protein